MVGLKLPKQPTQKPSASTRLLTSSAGPISRVVLADRLHRIAAVHARVVGHVVDRVVHDQPDHGGRDHRRADREIDPERPHQPAGPGDRHQVRDQRDEGEAQRAEQHADRDDHQRHRQAEAAHLRLDQPVRVLRHVVEGAGDRDAVAVAEEAARVGQDRVRQRRGDRGSQRADPDVEARAGEVGRDQLADQVAARAPPPADRTHRWCRARWRAAPARSPPDSARWSWRSTARMLLTPVTCSRASDRLLEGLPCRCTVVQPGERRAVGARHHELERVRAGQMRVDEERVAMQRRVALEEADQVGVVVHAAAARRGRRR